MIDRSGGTAVPPRRRAARLLPAALTVVSLLLVVSLLVPGRLAGQVFVLLGLALPIGLMALGAARRGRLDRWVGLAVGLLFVLLAASAFGILALSGSGAAGRWGAFGLPAATLLQLAGLWLLPLPLVALAYAWTFGRAGVTGDDLAALRDVRDFLERARRSDAAGGQEAPDGDLDRPIRP